MPGQQLWSGRGSKNQWLNQYFNIAAFQPNRPGSFGDTPRAVFLGPRQDSWDLGIGKNWRWQERYRLQFRWEMFNAFNTPSFSNPRNTITNSLAGKILSTGPVPPRVMQGALKLYF